MMVVIFKLCICMHMSCLYSETYTMSVGKNIRVECEMMNYCQFHVMNIFCLLISHVIMFTTKEKVILWWIIYRFVGVFDPYKIN